MQKKSWIIGLVAVLGLAACLDNDLERGLAGAAGGAVLADAVGGNAAAGAIIGGGVGVFCDDLGACN